MYKYIFIYLLVYIIYFIFTVSLINFKRNVFQLNLINGVKNFKFI